MEFITYIVMDKKEMAHPRNVARALERLAKALDAQFGTLDEASPTEGIVRDLSGTIVGRWELRSTV